MFDVRKPDQKPMVVIRAASGNELSNYEKHKLANIEENAQKNKIEIINVNGQRLQADTESKEVHINLGGLAFKNAIGPTDLLADDLFFIKCELSEEDLKGVY